MKKRIVVIVLTMSIGIVAVLADRTVAQIKIAAVFGRTGDEQQYGLPCYQAIMLAVEDINRQGGLLGQHLDVIEIDNKSTALGSKTAALQAIERDVAAVIGAAWSSNSLAMAPVLQEAGIPMISPISTNPQVTLEGDYIFRACFTDPFQGKVMAQFALRGLRAKSAVILTNISSDYSIGLSQYFSTSFVENGGEVLWEGKYLQHAIDFSDIVEQLKILEPDVVFSSGYERDSSLLLKQAIGAGIQSVFLGGDGWSEKMYAYVGQEIEGNYFSNHWHEAVSFSASRKILNCYREKYGQAPMTAAFPLAYDAVMLLAEAIRRAQSLDRGRIRDALAGIKDFQGATGTISFDEHGDPLNKDAVILKFDRGRVIFVETIKP